MKEGNRAAGMKDESEGGAVEARERSACEGGLEGRKER